VSSASRFNVDLSESAKNFLDSLSKRDAKAVALHLATFYKNGTPKNSRALTALEGEENDRVWTVGVYEILYRFFPDERRVEVGVIRVKQRTL
jgi:mRNA-degrading endonuclease RelE of RelBE toxin-antitoxin system